MKHASLIIVLILSGQLSDADPGRKPASDDRKPGILSSRSGRIDFEDEVIEGVNNSLDSLSQLARRDRKKDAHLYRRRENFRDESDQTVMDLGVKP